MLTDGRKTCIIVADAAGQYAPQVVMGPDLDTVQPQWLSAIQEIYLVAASHLSGYQPVALNQIDNGFARFMVRHFFTFWRQAPLSEVGASIHALARTVGIGAGEFVVEQALDRYLGVSTGPVGWGVAAWEYSTTGQQWAWGSYYRSQGYANDQVFEVYRGNGLLPFVTPTVVLLLPTEGPRGAASPPPPTYMPPQNDIVPPLPPVDAVTTEISSTGSYTGHVANVTVRNNSSVTAHTRILAGTILDPGNANYQTMVLTRDCELTVAPGATGQAAAYGCCANLHRSPPWSSMPFDIADAQSDDLIAAAYSAHVLGVTDSVAQQTIWLITDAAWPSDEAAVREVLVHAGIDPTTYGYDG